MQPEIKFRREEKSAKRPALEHMKRRIEPGKKTNYSRKSKIYDMEEKQIFKCTFAFSRSGNGHLMVQYLKNHSKRFFNIRNMRDKKSVDFITKSKLSKFIKLLVTLTCMSYI